MEPLHCCFACMWPDNVCNQIANLLSERYKTACLHFPLEHCEAISLVIAVEMTVLNAC